MVSVCFQGGLANRMFQYALYRSLISQGWDASIDNHNFRPRERMTFEAVNIKDAFPNISIKYTPKNKFRFSLTTGHKGVILRWLTSLMTKEQYVFEPMFKYCPSIFELITDNSELIGLWQTEKYFCDIADDIRKQFSFMPFTDEKNISVSNKMKYENSVAIHIRKGNDYTSDKLWDNTCPTDYYYRAINYIKDHINAPHFYLFTDNIEWVKGNLKDFEYTIVDWNPIKGIYNYRDMQLMSCAKHNIISNSTYSWWGAWLNPNKDKIVVAPKIWFNPSLDYFRNNDVICDNWIAL